MEEKSQKQSKKRQEKYEEKVAINVSFGDAVKILVGEPVKQESKEAKK